MDRIKYKITLVLVVLFIGIINFFALSGTAQTSKQRSLKTQDKVPVEQIIDLIHSGFGPKIQVESSSKPFYLLGDFNGDGLSDIAILVNVEEGREELKDYGVNFIDIDPYSRSNGSQLDSVSGMGHNCLGIALIQGTANGWNTNTPLGKYLFYECFSNLRLIHKGKRIRRGAGSEGPTPVPRGDSIQLELETGGTALVYWNGKTYRGFGQREGD